jgi:hypothetical protein
MAPIAASNLVWESPLWFDSLNALFFGYRLIGHHPSSGAATLPEFFARRAKVFLRWRSNSFFAAFSHNNPQILETTSPSIMDTLGLVVENNNFAPSTKPHAKAAKASLDGLCRCVALA